jgi:deoxycytidylate deaminase
MRLTFDEYGCLLALCAKSRSIDPHTRIGGCAFDKENSVIALSYNGLKPGVEMPDWMKLEEYREKKGDLFIHCESNLCARLVRNECESIFLSNSPCIKCCQNIAALNIKRVVYLKEYHRCNKFKEFFDFHGVEYRELNTKEKNRIREYLFDVNNFTELN